MLPVAIEFMDRPCIRATEEFAQAGYPDCEALLIVEVEGSESEIDEQLETITYIARRHDPVEMRPSSSAEESAAIWKGRGLRGGNLKLCVEVGGCLTVEHGVGVEKRDLMAHQYEEADLAMQTAVKDAFDPKRNGC